jgi:hypothetical protein
MQAHPVQLIVADDLQRSRLTVAFRALLAIPHVAWLVIWGFAAWLAAVASWFATLSAGRPPVALHDFLAAYVRYTAHVSAYLYLAADPYPGFTGAAGSYPVDVEIAPPAPQRRWKTALRSVLALPALAIAGALGLSTIYAPVGAGVAVGVAATVALLAWFACLAAGRMPRGFRDVLVFSVRYLAQLQAYLFLVTDRYPDSDPRVAAPAAPAAHPLSLRMDDDLRRDRVGVFFRWPLSMPHLVWATGWGALAVVVAPVSWLWTLAAGRSPRPLHRFLAAYVRYATRVGAYLCLVGGPFPGFTGRAGTYPVDVEVAPPAPQRRLVTAFRAPLALPALLVAGSIGGLLAVVAVLGWFAALVRGRMPAGLAQLGAYVLRYHAQLSAYAFLLLTDRYPDSGPEPAGAAAGAQSETVTP